MIINPYRFGVAGTPTWDSATKGAGITLSNSDRDASKAAGGYETVYGLVGRSSGRYAFEILVVTRPSASSMLIGIADKSNTANITASFLGNNGGTSQESIGYNDDNTAGSGRMFKNMTVGTLSGTIVTAYAASSIITVDVNIAANTVAFLKDGVSVTISGSATTAITSGKTWYPGLSTMNGSKGRLITTGLTYLPVGATEWG
jgi:hypothetical protein